jgi:hypothetical protein
VFILVWRLIDRYRVDPADRVRIRAGAHGEERVADVLARLSDEYWVLHDVRLVAKEPLQFEGKRLLSAQVDHLVVGPTGVFVIEAKNWSKAHASEERSFTPFQQVRRAGYVCFRILNDEVGETKVRQVVVPVGAPMRTDGGHHVDLVWPSRLCALIAGGNDLLSRDRVDGVSRCLQRYLVTQPE